MMDVKSIVIGIIQIVSMEVSFAHLLSVNVPYAQKSYLGDIKCYLFLNQRFCLKVMLYCPECEKKLRTNIIVKTSKIKTKTPIFHLIYGNLLFMP